MTELDVRGVTDNEAEEILHAIQLNIIQSVKLGLVQGKAFPEYVALQELDWLNLLGLLGEHEVDGINFIEMDCLGRSVKIVCATKDVTELDYELSE